MEQTITPERRAELAHLSAQAFAECDALSSQAQSEIISALEGADLATYDAVRTVWQGYYTAEVKERTDKAPEDEAVRKAWSRLIQASGLEKPKATTKEATERADARAKKAAGLAQMTPDEIAEEIAENAPKAADGDSKAAGTIKALKGEMERRAKAAEESEAAATKQLRQNVAAQVKACDHEMLETLRAVLGADESALALIRGVLSGDIVETTENLDFTEREKIAA